MEKPNPIQQAAAAFMDNLLKNKSQHDAAADVTAPETVVAAAGEINFAETFPKLDTLSTIWKEVITDERVSTYALRALLTDAAFHKAINESDKVVDFTITDDTVKKTKRQNDLIALAAAAKTEAIEEELAKPNDPNNPHWKRIFCIIYKELLNNHTELDEGLKLMSDTPMATPDPVGEDSGDEFLGGGGGMTNSIARLYTYLQNTDLPPGQKRPRGATTRPNIFNKTEDEIKAGASARRDSLKELIRKQLMKLERSPMGYGQNKGRWNALESAEKDEKRNIIIDTIMQEVIPPGIPPDMLDKLKEEKPGVSEEEWRLFFIDAYNGGDGVNAEIKDKPTTRFNRIFDILHPPPPKPHQERASVAPSVASSSAATSPIPFSSIDGPPIELEYASNYNIQSFVLEQYKQHLSDEDDSLPSCGNSVATSSGRTPSNATLSGDTPQNCYTNGNLLRVSPWVKHKDKYFLACQACGLPMFPASLKAASLTDPVYDEYKNPFKTNQMTPVSKDDLLKFAGKTQCDHDAPMAMMYNGLDRKAKSPYENIGIGSNFCPLHPICNTKKLNISPAVFWDWNKGTGSDKYEWNKKWTIVPPKPGDAVKFPEGPWGTTKATIDVWCNKNDWDPRYYAQLTQWKYFSALEELVKGDSVQFEKKLREAIKQASDLYRNMDIIKDEMKRVVNLIRQTGERINLKNIIVTLDVAKAAHWLMLIPQNEQIKLDRLQIADLKKALDASADKPVTDLLSDLYYKLRSEKTQATAAEVRAETAEARAETAEGEAAATRLDAVLAVAAERKQTEAAEKKVETALKMLGPLKGLAIMYGETDDESQPDGGGKRTRRNRKKSTKQTKKKMRKKPQKTKKKKTIRKKPRKTKRKNKKKKSKRTIKK